MAGQRSDARGRAAPRGGRPGARARALRPRPRAHRPAEEAGKGRFELPDPKKQVLAIYE